MSSLDTPDDRHCFAMAGLDLLRSKAIGEGGSAKPVPIVTGVEDVGQGLARRSDGLVDLRDRRG